METKLGQAHMTDELCGANTSRRKELLLLAAIANSLPRTRRREKRLEEEGGQSAGIPAMKGRAMGFLSFVGRVLFAFLFIFSAYKDANDFGTDGGPAAKSWEPKLNLFIEQVSNRTGMAVPYVEIKAFIAATFYLRVLGGGLLILDTKLGAGLLLFYLLSIIPVMIVYHSYTIERNSPQYVQLCFRSLKNIVFYIALYGAMLFFCGMKYDEELEDRRLLEKRRATRTKRRKTKTKTN